MLKPIKVLFIPTSNSGVSFYRLWSWAVAAHKNRTMLAECLWFQYDMNTTHPWEVDLQDPAHYARIMAEMNAKVRMADVVVMQMVHTAAALNLFLTIKEAYPHIPVLAEIDDHMLSTAEYNPASAFYAPGTDFRRLAVEQFASADAMIVSTPYLREVYSELNENIRVVPNSINFKLWDAHPRKKFKDQVRIGWAGGASHSEDLRIIEPVIHKVLEQNANARFVFVHGIPDFLRNIKRVECVSKFSRIDKYPKFLAGQGFDIGVAPLVDNAFNRGKSNLRFLEYGAMRVPCVASDVGHFKETVNTNSDGLLCKDEKEWIDSLNHLIRNKDERKRLGNGAYNRIRKDFNVDVNVFEYEKILRAVIEKGPKPLVTPEYQGAA